MNLESSDKPDCLQLFNVKNDDPVTPVAQVSSSLLSISSNKKFKNSSLSLNKKQNNHSTASNLLSSIKNSTLNVFTKPLSLSRSPSPQVTRKNQPIDLEAHIIVNKEIIESSDDEDDEEDLCEYDEEKFDKERISEIDELDNPIKYKRRRRHVKKMSEPVCKAVQEFDEEYDEEEEEEEEDSDSSLNKNNVTKDTSKLNTCSSSKPSLKTFSYANTATCSNNQLNVFKPASNKNNKKQYKVSQPISIKINDISTHHDEKPKIKQIPIQTVQTLPGMKTSSCEPTETTQPLKTILTNRSTNNLMESSSNLLDVSSQSQARQSVSFSADTLKTEKKEYNQQDSVVSAPLISNTYPSNLNKTLSTTCDNLNPGLTTSFTSSTLNTGLNSSYSPLLTNRQYSNTSQVPIKVLHKTMTKGSKAMRIMGSNNTNGLMANGFIKNSNSSGAVSLKSTSSRSSNSKKQQQKRLFFKNGNINISRCNIDKRRRRYLTDIFTTLIDLKWRYNILVFALGFFISWTFFAMTWYLICYFHGDLDATETNRTACVSGIHGFAGAILFSIETQQTIGYGVRFTTEQCPEAIIVMMIQSGIGVMIQSFMVGVVFAKLSRPKKRSETLMFSKNAVISLRDGRLCLICRVGDMRKSHIVEAHVRMYLIKKKVTLEGEIMPLHMYDLNVGWDKGLDRLFLVWPLTIEHNIDENSPFWTISADDLKKERFELAVILEGIVESTGMTTQARTSYLVNEILWGHRFEKLITFQKEDGTYKIDYSRFDTTVPIDTPTCSAKELDELREQEDYFSYSNLNESTISTFNTNDLRKRRVDKEDDEQNKLIDVGNNIRMVIEDHSDQNHKYDFDNLSSYNNVINSTPNTTTTVLSASTNQFNNENEMFNKLKI